MIRRRFNIAAALGAASLAIRAGHASEFEADGIVRNKSAYPVSEAVERITRDVESKGIMFFGVVDQAKLAKDASVDLRPSSLVLFGNPPLGTLFITAKAEAGLDWPVRLLVFEDEQGQVWTAYTDFHWIARRHNIVNRDEQFDKAAEVIKSIVSSTMV